MNETKNYIVKNKYLADAMAFLGIRYKKWGWGEETVYAFEDNEEFRKYLTMMLDMKKERLK